MNLPVILIVDDEIETRKLLREFLEERLMCNILEAENGEEALERLEEEECALMLLDIRMPRKSGIQVLDQGSEEGKKMPSVLVLTAWDSQWVAEECARRGVECLPKPFKLDELFGRVVKMLEGKGLYQPKQ